MAPLHIDAAAGKGGCQQLPPPPLPSPDLPRDAAQPASPVRCHGSRRRRHAIGVSDPDQTISHPSRSIRVVSFGGQGPSVRVGLLLRSPVRVGSSAPPRGAAAGAGSGGGQISAGGAPAGACQLFLSAGADGGRETLIYVSIAVLWIIYIYIYIERERERERAPAVGLRTGRAASRPRGTAAFRRRRRASQPATARPVSGGPMRCCHPGRRAAFTAAASGRWEQLCRGWLCRDCGCVGCGCVGTTDAFAGGNRASASVPLLCGGRGRARRRRRQVRSSRRPGRASWTAAREGLRMQARRAAGRQRRWRRPPPRR